MFVPETKLLRLNDERTQEYIGIYDIKRGTTMPSCGFATSSQIEDRMALRKGHFMAANMLESQPADYQSPEWEVVAGKMG